MLKAWLCVTHVLPMCWSFTYFGCKQTCLLGELFWSPKWRPPMKRSFIAGSSLTSLCARKSSSLSQIQMNWNIGRCPAFAEADGSSPTGFNRGRILSATLLSHQSGFYQWDLSSLGWKMPYWFLEKMRDSSFKSRVTGIMIKHAMLTATGLSPSLCLQRWPHMWAHRIIAIVGYTASLQLCSIKMIWFGLIFTSRLLWVGGGAVLTVVIMQDWRGVVFSALPSCSRTTCLSKGLCTSSTVTD